MTDSLPYHPVIHGCITVRINDVSVGDSTPIIKAHCQRRLLIQFRVFTFHYATIRTTLLSRDPDHRSFSSYIVGRDQAGISVSNSATASSHIVGRDPVLSETQWRSKSFTLLSIIYLLFLVFSFCIPK